MSSILTGPRVDHTHKSIGGRYVVASMNEGRENDVFILASPTIKFTEPVYCLKYWYLAYGEGADFRSDIAIDDIQLDPEACPLFPMPPPKTTPAPTGPTTAWTPVALTTKAFATRKPLQLAKKFKPMSGKPTYNDAGFQPLRRQKLPPTKYGCGEGYVLEPLYGVCCGNIHFSKSNGPKCCELEGGSFMTYQPRKQICCAGKLFDSRKFGCCNDQAFEKRSQFCCGEEIRERSEPERCCVSTLGWITDYNPKEKQCCKGSVGSLDRVCCGGDLIPNDERCCHQSVTPSPSWRLNGVRYNPSSSKRCCRSPDLSKSFHKAVIQDSEEEICCAGNVASKRDNICKINAVGEEFMSRRYPDYFVDFIFEDPSEFILDQFRGTNF
ncbi:Oidioi.mRNA.OKI2018_I69.chr2.g5184.t1.cds [Oikopleura dioica]|uniref:Oidioi.mRNA.OKI2018_I69.chr2.g5184.t1.cds n=1 Tax=Oikopleura dioica TaxID=34765 RepID=A0ABN7T3Z0_OIKDI|nr:Oidioi.mRNA.OKI2018_I69.chr2.g5184.t1.cds [Oikopleura dioica]